MQGNGKKRTKMPKIIKTATEEVAMVIERLDMANPPKKLDDYVNKIVEAKLEKAKTAAEKKNSGKTVGRTPKTRR